MLRVLVLAFALLATSACASGPSLQSAIGIHNQTKHVLEAADVVWAPVYADATRRADAAHQDDDKAYREAMEPYTVVNAFINAARQIEQAMYLAIEQWQAGTDDGGMLHEVAACGVDDLRGMSTALESVPAGAPLAAVSDMLAAQVSLLANGAVCKTPLVAAGVHP